MHHRGWAVTKGQGYQTWQNARILEHATMQSKGRPVERKCRLQTNPGHFFFFLSLITPTKHPTEIARLYTSEWSTYNEVHRSLFVATDELFVSCFSNTSHPYWWYFPSDSRWTSQWATKPVNTSLPVIQKYSWMKRGSSRGYESDVTANNIGFSITFY